MVVYWLRTSGGGLWKWDLPVQFHEPLTAFPRNPESPHLVGAKGGTDALFPLLIPEVGIKRSEFHLWQVACEIYWNAGRNLSCLFFFNLMVIKCLFVVCEKCIQC